MTEGGNDISDSVIRVNLSQWGAEPRHLFLSPALKASVQMWLLSFNLLI